MTKEPNGYPMPKEWKRWIRTQEQIDQALEQLAELERLSQEWEAN